MAASVKGSKGTGQHQERQRPGEAEQLLDGGKLLGQVRVGLDGGGR